MSTATTQQLSEARQNWMADTDDTGVEALAKWVAFRVAEKMADGATWDQAMFQTRREVTGG